MRKAGLFISSSSRCIIASARRRFSTTPRPIVELREYALHPEHAVAYMQATEAASELRKSLTPLRFFSLPETGGQLQVATHAYYYDGGHAQRDEKRTIMAGNPEWKSYIGKCRPYAQVQCSNIFVEAPLVERFEEVSGLAEVPQDLKGQNSILELRRYKLKLGYDTVPKFLELYGHGLPSKLSAEGTDPTTSLISVLHSDVGRLNEIIEIWRHGDGTTAMERSRVAARQADEWKKAIARIAELAIKFTSTIHKPTSFSPIR